MAGEKRLILKKNFFRCMSTSTGHALGSLVGDKSIGIKMMWFIAWLIGVAFTLFLIIQSLIEYFEYSVITNSRMINEKPIIFPKVTFCNHDAFSSLYALKLLYSYIPGAPVTTDLSLIKATVDAFILSTPNFYLEAQKKIIKMNSTERYNLGQTFTEFIYHPKFNNELIVDKDFEYKFDLKLGNCYSFNSDSKYKTSHPG